MGYILHYAGILIYNGVSAGSLNAMFAGSLIACLFWVSHPDITNRVVDRTKVGQIATYI